MDTCSTLLTPCGKILKLVCLLWLLQLTKLATGNLPCVLSDGGAAAQVSGSPLSTDPDLFEKTVYWGSLAAAHSVGEWVDLALGALGLPTGQVGNLR